MKNQADKAERETNEYKREAAIARGLAEKETDKADKADTKRREAEKKRAGAEKREKNTKEKYKTLFVGQMIFISTIALIWLTAHNNALIECGNWFVDRGESLLWFFSWSLTVADNAAVSMNNEWGPPIVLAYVIAGVVLAGILFGLFFLLRFLFSIARELAEDIGKAYGENAAFKAVISADITLGLFFVCITFSEPLTAAIPLNIFSMWIISSIVGVVLWNVPEIRQGVEKWKR